MAFAGYAYNEKLAAGVSVKLLFVTHWANNMLIFRTWMLQEAVRRGHEVLVLCPPDPEAARFAELGVRHIPWTLQRGGGGANMISAILNARQVFRREQPDSTVVYCVQPIMAVLWAWKLGGRYGKLFPTFTGLGSLWTDMDPLGWKKRMVRRTVETVFGYVLPLAEKVFVLNRDDKVQVASWNPKKLVPKVEQTMGEGVDLERFKPPTDEERATSRARWGFPTDARVIGFVGRLIREKGAQDFLTLCRELSSDPKVHFLVVGDPDAGNPTSLTSEEMVALEAIPRLRRERWMQDVRPAYSAMDVLVFLSAREGLPVSPQEAMAMGVPVVAYDAVGTREVVVDANCSSGLKQMPNMLNEAINKRCVLSEVTQWKRSVVQGCFLSNIEEGNI